MLPVLSIISIVISTEVVISKGMISIVIMSKNGPHLYLIAKQGNTKGESITVPLTSCLTGLD
jgi:hypothetical protein